MNKKRKVTKKIAAWLLCLAMVLTTVNLPAFQTEVQAAACDGANHNFSDNGTCVCGITQITYEVIGDTKTVRVTGPNEAVDQTGDLVIPSTVRIDGDDYSVTEIGDYAFSFSTFTGNLTIPDSVTTIGKEAFADCGFTGSLTLGNSVTTIGEYAFYFCKFTGNLTIPDSVTTIGACTFSNCGFTGNLVLGNSVATIGYSTFSNCGFTGNLVLGNSVTTIDAFAFGDCGFTGSLTIPDSVTTIGACAFARCHNIEGISIPCSVKNIGEKIFLSNTSFVVNPTVKVTPGSVAETYVKENYPDLTVDATGTHHFSVKVNETTHKCANCDAIETHKFSSDCDTTCNDCGHVIDGATGNHNFFDQGDGTHKCADCGVTEKHDFLLENGTNNGAEKCTLCNVKNIASSSLDIKATSTTYTGEEQTAVITGIEAENYTVTGNTATNAGKYTITLTGKGDYTGTREVEWTIEKATPTVDPPTSANPKFAGACVALVTAGSTNFGTMLYSLDDDDYSENIPCADKGGDYTVYYKVEESDNWYGAAGSVEIQVPVRVDVTVVGDGSVNGYDSDEFYPVGTVLTLIAEPDENYRFTGWDDDFDAPAEREWTVLADAKDNELTVNFQHETHDFKSLGVDKHKCSACNIETEHNYDEVTHICSNCNQEDCRITGNHDFSDDTCQGTCTICGAKIIEITTWAQLKDVMEHATEPTTIVLTQDIVATAEDKAIAPAETSIVLDLNGYTLDRNLSEPESDNNGCVFFMQLSSDVNLTIKDSSPAKTGVITGGYATGCAGCIELWSGSLTLLGGTITGNKTLYYGGGIDKSPYAKLMVGGTARVIGNYAYETGIKQWNSDIHFNDNVLDGFSFATGDDALVTEGEHKAQFGIRFWTGVDIAPELWTLPSREAGSCFVSNNQREKYRTSVEEDDGEFLLCLTLHDHEFDGIKCTSACELCGMVREDGIHNMKGEGCTQECSYCHIKVHSNDIYDSKGVCPQCKAHRVDDETLLDYQGVRYRLKVDSKLNTYAEVYGYADDIKESVVIPKTIATSNGVFRVASFAAYCFKGCTRVKDVDIQAEVTFIANDTFEGCNNLTSVVIPNSVTEFGTLVFKECSSLASINLPDGLTTIGSFAFNGCSSLTSINLPEGLTTIGSDAFENCSSLASINLPEGLTTIGSYAFFNCSALKSIVIPGSVQTIDNYAFRSTGLTSVTINQGVEEISGYDVFSNCLSLTDVSLPGSLKTIGAGMFGRCTSLAEIVIPNGVETIKNSAFSNCTSLTEVVIPDGVKFIRQNAFGKCTNLKSVTIPSSVISVELYYNPTFDGCSSDKLVINVACTEYLNEVTPKQWGDIKEINRVHDFTAEEAKDEALKSEATCLDKAVYYRSCTVCGHVHESDDDVFKYGSALGHEYTSETATAPYLKSKATCIKNAVYFHKCSRCESKGATTWTKTGTALGHSWGEYALDGDQTCDEDGYKTAMCTREGCTVTNTIEATGAALGHDYTSETATAPYLKSKATCIADAVYFHKCSRCESRGATTWTKEGSALGHEWGEYHLDGDQTCTYDGHKTAECTREGCSEENKIGATGAALGHDWEDYFTTDIAATCTEAGSESRHCARCSATTDVAPIVAHGHSFTDYISNGDATTEADGTKTAVCDHGCGETDTVIDEGSRITETCRSHEFKSLGIEKHKCSVCDTKAAHNYDEATHICSDCNQEDCRATGTHDFVAIEGDSENHKCLVCGTQRNHDFSDQQYINDGSGKHYQECKVCGAKSTSEAHSGGTATCTAKATCEKCGVAYGETGAHSFINHVSNKDATCTADGFKDYYKCGSCDKLYKEAACINEITDLATWKTTDGQGKIAALGHAWGYNASGATLTATCTRNSSHTATLTLTASSANYSGSAASANFDETEILTWETVLGGTVPDISYEYKATADGTYTATTETKNVGFYRASATVDTNKTASVEYEITAITIADSNVTISEASYDYDETAKTPSVTVKATVGGKETTLDETTDYTVTGEKTGTAIGDYTITVTGNGNFKGSVTKTWSIKKIAAAGFDVEPTVAKENGTEITVFMPAAIAEDAKPLLVGASLDAKYGTVEYKLDDGTWTTSVPTTLGISEGTHKVYYRIKGNSNYNDVEKTSWVKTITVKAGQVSVKEPEINTSVTNTITTVKSPNAIELVEDENVVAQGKVVEVKLKINEVAEAAVENKTQLNDKAVDLFDTFATVKKTFLDIVIEKKEENQAVVNVPEIAKPIEIEIALGMDNGKKIAELSPVIIRAHKTTGGVDITVFNRLGSCPANNYVDGTFYVDVASNKLYMYSSKHSEYVLAYSPNTLTIVIDAKGVTNMDPISVNANSSTLAADIYEKLSKSNVGNYRFDGWYADAEYNTVFNADYAGTIDAEMILYPKYTYVEPAAPTPNNGNNKPATKEVAVNITYTVVKGDTMWKIARQYGLTLAELKALNPQIKDMSLIYPNQVINVGTETKTVPADGSEETTTNKVNGEYIVEKGDNLTKIAKKYKMKLKELVALNPQIKNIDLIYPGQKIKVFE